MIAVSCMSDTQHMKWQVRKKNSFTKNAKVGSGQTARRTNLTLIRLLMVIGSSSGDKLS